MVIVTPMGNLTGDTAQAVGRPFTYNAALPTESRLNAMMLGESPTAQDG